MKKLVFALTIFQFLVGCAQLANEPAMDQPPSLDSVLKPSRPLTPDVSETRRQLLEDAGRTVGFRGGKAQRAWELRQAIERRAVRLDLLYDFRTLISPEGWLPPVIDEAVDVAHITSDQIRTAHQVYQIIASERFVSNPPSWRKWLLAGLGEGGFAGPESAVVPETSSQRGIWQEAIRKGWEEGRTSADHIMEANFNRLIRDYRGMLMYSYVLRQGLISKPVVSDKMQSVTGDRYELTTGDRLRTIKEKAGFIPDKTKARPMIRRTEP
ncbi:type IV secretory system conjugative DNA transfer family protein [Pseudomonas fulva]|uniref:type IV secretory system conjugative DNA transfer family protein n=1 Tax=Pseudomonas fulva TaxID=47880 RepID=UPI002DB971CD|nr:type IV secretory system conjugative DNA transfer family protein [Pseudomonas fulva]MEB8059280.1 type IV secretion system DotC family protein [Pseudomonas fulva]